MNTEIVEMIKDCLSSLPFMDKVAGLSYVGEYKDHKLPFEVCKQDVACTTENSLAPNDKYKSIMYFIDKGVKLEKKHACTLTEYSTDLRLMFWFNHKALGQTECVKDKVIHNIIRELSDRRCYNDVGSDYLNISVEDIKQVPGDIFKDYDYDKTCAKKLFKEPYEYFALDFKVRFFYSYSCDETLTINPAITC